MSRSYEVYGDWAKHDGKIVNHDGQKWRLRVTDYVARYPYVQRVINVDMVCVDTDSEYYQSEKRRLRDDWSVDVLDSGPELETEILRQLV